MSLPDYQLDPPEDARCACGTLARDGWAVCAECRADLEDVCADEAIQNRMEVGR